MVLLKFSLGPGLCTSMPWPGIDGACTWAAEIFQYSATLCHWAVGILLLTATLLWAVGSGTPAVPCHTAVGSGAHSAHGHTAAGCGQRKSSCTRPHCPGAVGGGTPAIYRRTARGAVGSGQCVVWCGVVWCGVVWCAKGAVTKRQWLRCLAQGKMQNGRCVCINACCVSCVAHLWQRAVTLSDARLLLSKAALGMPCRSTRWCYQSSR